MAYQVDFKEVTPVGLASSPVKDALAGLRANEARYFWNKYHRVFVTRTVAEDPETVPWVDQILAERDLHFPYPCSKSVALRKRAPSSPTSFMKTAWWSA